MSQEKEQSFVVKYKKELLIGLIAVLMLTFIVRNSHQVDFYLVFFKVKISVIFLIALFYALGMITVWLRFHFLNKDKDKKFKQMEERLKELEKQLPPTPPSM
ncbi:MAG: LapA family protein [Flavobacteriales bacterium]|nr:LapA family protein [Flavobacteriales bacterium]